MTATQLDGVPTLSVSFGQILRVRRLHSTLAWFGPAFVAAIAYVDPGNFSTNFTAGARYGYRLVWVVVLANLMAMPMQYLSAKIGIVTGRSLPEICRDRCPRTVAVWLWIQAELVAIATDLAEFIGGAIGLNLVFGIAPMAAGLITAVAAFALLGLQSRGSRPFERILCFALIMILTGFLFQLLHTGTDAGSAAHGLIPTMGSSGAVYLSAGIVGATMMPHVVYLHSSMTSQRTPCPDDQTRRRSLKYAGWDVVVALGLAGLINLCMLLVAARVFAGSGTSVGSLAEVHRGLGAMLGGGVALAFAGALLVSGISSAGVGTLAGQTVMSGFLNLRVPLLLRRGVTMAPALVVLAMHVNATAVLNFSQVALSFGIPFALLPLVLIGRSRTIMGGFANRAWVTGALVVITSGVVGLNLALLYGQFAG